MISRPKINPPDSFDAHDPDMQRPTNAFAEAAHRVIMKRSDQIKRGCSCDVWHVAGNVGCAMVAK